MASIIKVDQIQSDSGTVNVSSNLASHNIVSGTTNHIRMFDTRSSTGVGTMIGANQDGNTYYDSNYNNTATAGGHVFRGAGSELATITSSGRLNLPYGQITFPASQNASSDANTLDDYEEGAWTPTLTRSGGGTSVTYSLRNGRYTKIGRMVNIQCTVYITAVAAQGSGICLVTGLPYSYDITPDSYINAGVSVTYNTLFATNVVRAAWFYYNGISFMPHAASTSEISDTYQAGFLTFNGTYYTNN